MPNLIQAFFEDPSTQNIQQFYNLQTSLQHLQLRVDGQSLLHINLEQGDILHFDLHIGQSLEVLVFQNQKIALETLQASNHHQTLRITKMVNTLLQLQQNNQTAERLRKQIHHLHLDIHQDTDAIFICQETAQQFIAHAQIEVIIFNTGLDMQVNQQNPIDEVKLSIDKNEAQAEYLPTALAQPIQEFRVSKATALSYTVKQGQWIQIIDLSGKQCSDFLAFDADQLQQGREVGLDSVATRSILGHSTPLPGIHSRFYSTEMQALVEVVQDTVGRHDMFLTACSSKFYDDSGYFGHISCTENFNQVLSKYGIAHKSSWPAINFFYNTEVQPCGTINMDEPWSRPGDFILLRATRDLLCASSACPDDIDPSNGWIPTDIYIRIYDAKENFPRAQAYRLTAEEPPRMTKKSGFYSRIHALTTKLVEYHGYWVATEYDGWGTKAEYHACRERVAMIDLSALRKFEIIGPDAERFLQFMLTRNIRKLAINEIAYSASCLDTGGMVDDGTVFRLGENNFRWVCGDEYSGIWLRKKAKELNFSVSIRNSSDQIHNLAVQGPNSRVLLQGIIWTPEHQTPIEKLSWFHFTLGRLGDANGVPVMVSRTGYTGELGFEVWCHPNHASEVWDTIWQKGQQYQIAPMGFDALDMLRIEAGLIFAQHEFNTETNPYEAGIGFTVPLKTKEENFLGKEAMQNQSVVSRHKLVGLILDKNEPAVHGDLIYSDRFPVGVVTSSTNSPYVKKHIALCRIAPQYAEIGTEIEIGKLDGQQKRLKAKVVALPFYDPERTRIRS